MAKAGDAKKVNATAVRFEPDLYRDLTKAARDRGVSISFMVNEAVRYLLPALRPAEEYKASLTKPTRSRRAT